MIGFSGTCFIHTGEIYLPTDRLTVSIIEIVTCILHS